MIATRTVSATIAFTLLVALAVPLSGCGEKGPTIDDAVFVPDPSLPTPKNVTPAAPPAQPAVQPTKAAETP